MTNPASSGPDPEAITRTILARYPDADLVTIPGAWFFSLDPERHWPNFATIVTTDEHDEGAPSDLTARPGVFRLNLGVSRGTFERVAGAAGKPDYAATDRLVPHPTYAKQRWISVLNPTQATFTDIVLPLLDEAHDLLAARSTRIRAGLSDT
jgi:hypothetical protein